MEIILIPEERERWALVQRAEGEAAYPVHSSTELFRQESPKHGIADVARRLTVGVYYWLFGVRSVGKPWGRHVAGSGPPSHAHQMLSRAEPRNMFWARRHSGSGAEAPVSFGGMYCVRWECTVCCSVQYATWRQEDLLTMCTFWYILNSGSWKGRKEKDASIGKWWKEVN